jgi:hypothetical protein
MAAGSAAIDTYGMTASPSTAVIRQWARDNGLPVGDRGRLSPQLLSAYASSSPATARGLETTIVTGAGRASARAASPSLRIRVQPTPGATGIAHKIAARVS